MFDGWVDIGLLSQAFDLSVPECIDLARHIPCELNPRSPTPKYDLEKIDDYAEKYARQLIGNSDQSATQAVINVAMQAWRNSPGDAGEVWGIYKKLWNKNDKEEAYNTLWPMTRIFFLTEWRVDKVQAVRFLAQTGYPFKKEVKGLAKAFVDCILAEESTQQQPPAPSSGQDPTPATGKTAVTVPSTLWAGKTPEGIVAKLSAPETEYAPAVIAYILMEKVGGIAKASAGRLLRQEEINKGVVHEDRTYERHVDKLLGEAKSKYSITFDE